MSATGGTGGQIDHDLPRQQNDHQMINTNADHGRDTQGERSTLGYSAYARNDNRGTTNMQFQDQNYVQRDVSEI